MLDGEDTYVDEDRHDEDVTASWIRRPATVTAKLDRNNLSQGNRRHGEIRELRDSDDGVHE